MTADKGSVNKGTTPSRKDNSSIYYFKMLLFVSFCIFSVGGVMSFFRTEKRDLTISSLLNGNNQWKQQNSASFFSQHAQGQKPEALFISCSDSRVSPSAITQSRIGQLFEFRNIANLALSKDKSLQAVLHYAVSKLHIKHIIICGHYGCGGIQTAMKITDNNLQVESEISEWLKPIITLYKENKRLLSQLLDPEKRYKKLVELNVESQVTHLENSAFIKAFKRNNEMGMPIIHGAVYDLETGKLKFLGASLAVMSASVLKDKIGLEIKRLDRFAKSNNPFLFIGAHKKALEIKKLMKKLSDDDLLAGITQTDSELYLALNKKRTLPFSFWCPNLGGYFSRKSQTLLSLGPLDNEEKSSEYASLKC